MRSILPATIIAVGALLAADRVVQPTMVSTPQTLLPRGGPIKVLGIPAPDEWIDIESNEAGQPTTTYTVPDGHCLTLVSVFSTPPVQGTANAEVVRAVVSIDGVTLTRSGEFWEWDIWDTQTHVLPGFGATQQGARFVPGTVVQAQQVLGVARLDPGDTADNNFAADDATYTVRGFLEKMP